MLPDENVFQYSQQDLYDGVEKRKYEYAGQVPGVDIIKFQESKIGCLSEGCENKKTLPPREEVPQNSTEEIDKHLSHKTVR